MVKAIVNTLSNEQTTSRHKFISIKSRRLMAVAGLVLVVVLIIAVVTSTLSNVPSNEAEQLCQQAKTLENQGKFTEACDLYWQALPLLLAQNSPLTQQCREGAERLVLFQCTYTFNTEQVKTYLSQFFPDVSAQQIDEWVSSGVIEHYAWDGDEHYFSSAAENIRYNNLALMQANASLQKTLTDLVVNFDTSPAESSEPYKRPVTYHAMQTLNVPRDVLPANGTLKIWFPLPINSGPQTVVIESVTPDTYVKQAPSVDQDIGLLYLEVPLEQLQDNLNIQIKFSLTHYRQGFNIDPANVGTYDKNSDLYKEYTKSYGNTEITPDIQNLAKQIVGGENNPYIAAKKIYDYVVYNVTYALMPHAVLWPRTSQTESTYVHEYKRGDCGAQSMYFSALCRSLGIPARATGGWQLFNGQFASHFWAEFYLPNYGWIPVDTSVAQVGFYPKNVTDQQRESFINYFFANQDSMRCIVQKNVDMPLIPSADGSPIMPMAIQEPAVLCTTITDTIPGLIIIPYWINNVTSITQQP